MPSPDLRRTPDGEQEGEAGSGVRRRATERLRSLKVGEEENQIDIGSNQAVAFYFDSTGLVEGPAEQNPTRSGTSYQKACSRNSLAASGPLSRTQANAERRQGASMLEQPQAAKKGQDALRAEATAQSESRRVARRGRHLDRSSALSGTHLHPFEEQSELKTSRARQVPSESPLTASASAQHLKRSQREVKPVGHAKRKEQAPAAGASAKSEKRAPATAETESCRPGSSTSQSHQLSH